MNAFSLTHQLSQLPKLQQRVLVGLILGAFWVSIMFMGSWALSLFLVFVLIQGTQELTALYEAKQVHLSKGWVICVGLVLILLAHYRLTLLITPILALGLIGGFVHLLFKKPLSTLNDIGATFVSLIYVGFLPVHFSLLRQVAEGHPHFSTHLPFHSDPGFLYLFCLSLVIVGSDAGAYFIGKHFGKHLLYPQVSPKKTREGAIGGIITAFLIGLTFVFAPGFTLLKAAGLSLLLAIAAPLGDLTESLMKRDAGIKDSGTLFLSHGGLLDRMDSYFFCGTVAYYYIHWIILKEGLPVEVLKLLG